MHPDVLLRIALTTYLIALDSGLTSTQQAWLSKRLASQAPLTPVEKQRLKGPLLAWCARHGIEKKVAAEFEETHA